MLGVLMGNPESHQSIRGLELDLFCATDTIIGQFELIRVHSASSVNAVSKVTLRPGSWGAANLDNIAKPDTSRRECALSHRMCGSILAAQQEKPTLTHTLSFSLLASADADG